MVGLNLCRCAGKKDNANTHMVSVRSLVSLCPVTQNKQGALTIVQMRKRRLRRFVDLFTTTAGSKALGASPTSHPLSQL